MPGEGLAVEVTEGDEGADGLDGEEVSEEPGLVVDGEVAEEGEV